MSIEKQQTLKSAASLKGIGLHSGVTVNVNIFPAPEGHGIQFKRIDLEGAPLIKADATNIYKSNRHTVLGSEKAFIGTVEHLMSAFYALGIDNALVEADAEELPILDGVPYLTFRQLSLQELKNRKKKENVSNYSVLLSSKMEIQKLQFCLITNSK